MENFEEFVDEVRKELAKKDVPGAKARADATANSLEQIGKLTPEGITLADLKYGWEVVVKPEDEDDGKIASRRETCAELAAIATRFANGEGSKDKALEAWRAWANAFEGSEDPRQKSMRETFAREYGQIIVSGNQ